MLDVIRLLNEDKDRCILIDRNALNYQIVRPGSESIVFHTMDFDLVCPDHDIAEECREILENHSFMKDGATFIGGNGELDLLLADPSQPQCVIGGYYNIPSLYPLWEARERKDGILSPPHEAIIMNKLLNIRDNLGKDIESVAIYFNYFPEKLELFLEKIDKNPKQEDREAMLYSLYEAVTENPVQKEAVEKVIIGDIGRSNKISQKHQLCDSKQEEFPSGVPQRREFLHGRLYGPGTLTVEEDKATLRLSPKCFFNVPRELLSEYKTGDVVKIQSLRFDKDGCLNIREQD